VCYRITKEDHNAIPFSLVKVHDVGEKASTPQTNENDPKKTNEIMACASINRSEYHTTLL